MGDVRSGYSEIADRYEALELDSYLSLALEIDAFFEALHKSSTFLDSGRLTTAVFRVEK